jgi:hypothetical protein
MFMLSIDSKEWDLSNIDNCASSEVSNYFSDFFFFFCVDSVIIIENGNCLVLRDNGVNRQSFFIAFLIVYCFILIESLSLYILLTSL